MLEQTKRKKNYLNNKDMLKEIAVSKNSYCAFANPIKAIVDSQYDIILENVKEIFETKRIPLNQLSKNTDGKKRFKTIAVIDLAKQARSERLAKEGIQIKPEDINVEDLVFRVMTEEHIPLVPKKKSKIAQSKATKKAKSNEIFDELLDDEDVEEHVDPGDPDVELVPMRVNFPSFFHYRLTNEMELKVVCKSHWKGDLENGQFCKTHGRISNNLAHMWVKLCERYATRSNWRGYCVDKETECLTQRGWISSDELTTDDQILSYDGNNMIWSGVRSIYRDQYDGLMFKMSSRSIDALVTPGHKIVTDKGLVKIDHLVESDRIVVMGNSLKCSDTKTYDDNFVELMGWITTEGNYQHKKKLITVYQNAGIFADRIRNCLNALGYEYTERQSKKSTNISFNIRKKHWDAITSVMPNKNPTMSFLLSLTEEQRKLLLDTMINGDGWSRGNLISYAQKNKEHVDMFQALCALNGLKSNSHFVENKMSFGKPVSYYVINVFSRRGNYTRGGCIDLHGGKNNGRNVIGKGKHAHPNYPTIPYRGIVWCPETEYGSFLARRNGKIYLTGNSYNDEMQHQALLQLTQIGLRFNELKSQNPFAYYTAVVTNSFTRVLNIEKRMQKIRDDILEANGLTPSWSRQMENENFSDPSSND